MLRDMKQRLLLLTLLPFLFAADVYKTEAEDGTVEYSDQPQEQPEKLDLPPILGIEPPPSSATQKTLPGKPSVPAVSSQHISIQSPRDDEGVRSNQGELMIILHLAETLQPGRQHIELQLDNRHLKEHFQKTQIVLPDIERGTHTLRALLVDEQGQVLARSSPVRFHLLRHSILFSQ
ncbi:MAG: DUF4124 domain-containing protein [Gammaproteobacteria bacterium]|nr:DUF4124 domain-containing protein [Gammaproteobacteria bacterium]